jgi:hypothetical protein
MSVGRVYRIAVVCLLAGVIGSALASPAMAKKRTVTPAVCRSSSIAQELETEPVELAGAPEPEALSQFGVLRRAAGPADQLPPLNQLGLRLDFELASYYPGYIRQLVQLSNGRRYFLIPGLKRAPNLPPAQCLPMRLRQLPQPKPEPVYCIAGIGATVRRLASANCQTLGEIETGGDLADPYFSSSFQVDLVPDGVATVRLVYRGGIVITAPVSENAFSFTPPQGPIARERVALQHLERTFDSGGKSKSKSKRLTKRQRERRAQAAIKLLTHALSLLPPKQVQWLDANGHVLRSFTPRRAHNSLLITTGSIVGVSTGGSVSITSAGPIG